MPDVPAGKSGSAAPRLPPVFSWGRGGLRMMHAKSAAGLVTTAAIKGAFDAASGKDESREDRKRIAPTPSVSVITADAGGSVARQKKRELKKQTRPCGSKCKPPPDKIYFGACNSVKPDYNKAEAFTTIF